MLSPDWQRHDPVGARVHGEGRDPDAVGCGRCDSLVASSEFDGGASDGLGRAGGIARVVLDGAGRPGERLDDDPGADVARVGELELIAVDSSRQRDRAVGP
jgi:hypothetical protein